MRKFILFTFLITIFCVSVSSEAQIWGMFTQPPRTLVCVQDSMLGATAETVVNVSGQGILRRVVVDNARDDNNEVVEVILDGTSYIDSTSTTTNTVYYLCLNNVPAASTTEDAFRLSTTSGDLNAWFKDQCIVKFRTASDGTMYISVFYEIP